jgi:4-hydroxy-tetrahydrodipicolinate reductase
VLAVGLGPIGRAAAEVALGKASIELVGAVEADPAKQGRDLAELLGLRERSGIVVEGDLDAAIESLSPQAALLCTSSFLPEVQHDVRRLARAGVHVVSPCEEMLVPDFQHPQLAADLDLAARRGGATVVGTGVNPGFVLDFLPIVLSGACRSVRRIRGCRVVDAASRREPLQRKVGAGLTEVEFSERLRGGRMGHQGMRESVALLDRALGLGLDSITQTVEPVLAERRIVTDYFTVEPGQVAGVKNIGLGRRGGETVVELELRMFVGAPRPRDEVEIEGEPPLRLVIEGGVAGDVATAAILVNTVPRAAEARPGLLTILDLAPSRRIG